VQCWGNNDYGQLGDSTYTDSNVPVDVVGLGGASDITAGSHHTCVLIGSAVWCWGRNHMGQVGDGSTSNRSTPVQVLTGASSFTAGADYTCAGLLAGGVTCWGNNAEGQLGDGTKTNRSEPTLATQITNVHGVDGGQSRTYALTGAGVITAWSGGLIPVAGAEAAETHKLVSADRFSSLVIGVNPEGIPITIDSSGANEVSGVSGVIDVDSGLAHACALLGGGSVKCWGANNYGQLGDGSDLNSKTPVSVKNLPAAQLLAVGRNHACVIVTATETSTVIKCWGLNTDGQLGNGANTNSKVPVDVKVTD
jgi:alpha-tubulin suppressor-like RCC1 family protein